MTISSEGNINTYAGDGADTTFEFTFPILDESHLEVEEVNDTTGVVTTKTLTTHYTVSGSGNTSGSTDFTSGTVTFGTAPASGVTVVIRYDVPITQAVDLQENDNFPAETIEDSLDKLAMTDSMQEENIERALRLNAADTTLNDTIIKGVPGANKVIQIDSGGDDFEFVDIADINGYPVLDEDDMVSDSASHVATQQSIKAYVDANLATDEAVQDIVGGMVTTTNTETGITVTYQDATGDIDFVVDDTTVAGDTGSTGITPGDTLTIAGGTKITTAMSGDTLTINNDQTDEAIQDLAGAMVTGNTETGITVTYQDGDGTLDFVVSDTTVAGDSGSTGITPGDTLTIAGGTNVTTSMSGDTLSINVDDAFLLNNGDVGTGVYDFGGATTFEIPNSATPAVAVDGQIAIDTTITDFSAGLIRYYSGEEMVVIAVPAAQVVSPTDTYVIKYNATNDEFELAADAGAGGGISNVVEDTTPQLGGQLDVNGNAIGNGTNELITFVEDASAVNHVNIENEATGSGPIISAAGDDANIDLNLNGKATGNVVVRDGTDVTKDMSFELSGATTAKTATITSSHTDDRTITLPDATDTLVGKATTDTFTNKTFDANGTGNSLSNVDVADLANGTDGELITWDATGAPATVSVGTANRVLTSNGAGAAPTFQSNPYDIAFNAGFSATMVKEDAAVQTYGELVMTRSGSFNGEAGYADTAPTGAALICDIEKNGTTIYSTKPQFAATSQTLTAGSIKSDGTEDFVSGDRITFKITQVGSTEPGEGIRFTVDAILT